MRKSVLAGVAVLVFAMSIGAPRADATVIVGGLAFDDDAFADVLLGSSGSYTLGGAGTLQDQLVGTNVADYAFSYSPGAFVLLGFTDNTVVNGTGSDLALFELGIPDTLTLTIGGTTFSYLTVGTGFSAGGFALNVALIDLSDFGLAFGSSVDQIRLGLDTVGSTGTVPSLTAAGALNSGDPVPEPGTLLLLGSGIATLVARRRRQV
jgi:hypothetical protein